MVDSRNAKTYHAGVHPSGLDIPFLRALRNSGAEIVSVEVYTHAEEVVPRSDLQYELLSFLHVDLSRKILRKEMSSRRKLIFFSGHRALVSTGHIFSPNEREAASLVGPGPPLEMIERLSELGAEVSSFETWLCKSCFLLSTK